MFTRLRCLPLLLCLALVPWRAAPSAALASAPAWVVTEQAEGVLIRWSAVGLEELAGVHNSKWPIAQFDDHTLPRQLVAAHWPAGPPRSPEITVLRSRPLTAEEQRRTIDRPAYAATPSSQPTTDEPLPTAATAILRQARLRAAQVAVVAVTPVYRSASGLVVAEEGTAWLPGATLLPTDPAPLLATTAPFLALDEVAAPTLPGTPGATIRLAVAQQGMQRVTGAALAALGVDIAGIAPAQLRLQRGDSELPLELRGTGDGRFDAQDELRFWAAPPGDRWNRTDTYWLSWNGVLGLRMSTRSTLPAAAALRTNAFELGTWRGNRLYDSTAPGPDGDYWYSADLRVSAGEPAAQYSFPIATTLSPLAGTTVFTLTGTAYTAGQHRLSLAVGGAVQSVVWQGRGNWTHAFTLTTTSAVTAVASLLPSATATDGVEVDALSWQRPVALDLKGRGAIFRGVPGTWRYQLTNPPANRTLYDITNPAAPRVLSLSTAAAPAFQDGAVARVYVVAGPGTLWEPVASLPLGVALAAPMNAAVIFIAPAAFHAALAPLVALRQSQGYTTALVDVATIYENWSAGQVSPTAIRNFLRYAAAWPRPPLSVLLVGDGSADPRNYLGFNNPTHIPPYLAHVDPLQGETACETCYAQLDGVDPIRSPDSDWLPDLMLGRLPVQTMAQLEGVVAKIIQQAALLPLTATPRLAMIADNYGDTNGNFDPAGDFAAFSDAAAAMQPAPAVVERVYYDPQASAATPWREAAPEQARLRVGALLDAGNDVVQYTGHASRWQWAETDLAAPNPYLLSLYDADTLRSPHPAVLLAMTCLTSAFHAFGTTGTTLDERLLINKNGGAVAVWGPTGQSVAHGHNALLDGFYTAAWQSAPGKPQSLGALAQAGYLHLWATDQGCCLDTIHTYAILGDPLTSPRLAPPYRMFLLFVHK